MMMRRHLPGVAAVMLMAIASPAVAEDSAAFWLTMTSDVRVDRDTSATADMIVRSRPDSATPGQLFFRVGVRQALGNGWVGAANYAVVDTRIDDGADSIEHRFSQTLGRSVGALAGGAVDMRATVEQRLPDSGGALGWRLRGRVRWVAPLSSRHEVQLSEEAIASLNSTAWGQRSGMTATRTGIAVRHRVSPRVGIALGYTWQHGFRRNAGDRDDHIAGLTIDAHL